MMRIFYSVGIFLFHLIINIASLFNVKARLWVGGRKNIFESLEKKIDKTSPLIWFHCASLGEFEQGRPVIEALRLSKPEYKILLTFFSPSGYEVRKNYAGVDYVFYLPMDTVSNARRFIELVQPQMVFFVKYEFWYNYINLLHKKGIALISFQQFSDHPSIFLNHGVAGFGSSFGSSAGFLCKTKHLWNCFRVLAFKA